jgi:hypothetical protein
MDVKNPIWRVSDVFLDCFVCSLVLHVYTVLAVHAAARARDVQSDAVPYLALLKLGNTVVLSKEGQITHHESFLRYSSRSKNSLIM